MYLYSIYNKLQKFTITLNIKTDVSIFYIHALSITKYILYVYIHEKERERVKVKVPSRESIEVSPKFIVKTRLFNLLVI